MSTLIIRRLHGAPHPQAGGPYPVEERSQVGQAGLRREVGGPAAVLLQHAEQPAQVAERLPAGVGDRAERLAGSLGGARGSVPAIVGEADDHRQVVRDDVVHLAGYPGTFGCRGKLRLGFRSASARRAHSSSHSLCARR